MRQFLAIALASTFLTTAPAVVVNQPAEARSLFETLFPRAAERRKQRRAKRLERQRQLILLKQREAERRNRKKKKVVRSAPKIVKVKAPTFNNYVPVALKTVRLAGLAKAFSAYEQKMLAKEALEQEKLRQETKLNTEENDSAEGSTVVLAVNNETSPDGNARDVLIVNASNPVNSAVDPTPPVETGSPMRLSAGHGLLKQIKLKTRSSLAKALLAHYKENPEFLWLDKQGNVTPKATAVLNILADADSYGLRSADYALASVGSDDDGSSEAKLRAAMSFEFSLTVAALRYMGDARNGLVDPNKISGYHDFRELGGRFKSNVEALAQADDAASLLLASHPKEKAFLALKEELNVLRAKADNFNAIEIARKTLIKPGQNSDQLAKVVESIRRKATTDMRAQHFDVFAVDHGEGEYTPEVVALVRDFQKSVGLKADGIVGRNTIAKMREGDPKVQLNKVLYAMERMRWHPDQFGDTHVFINQPAYRATFVKGGKNALSMRAVVGKPSNQTNFFYDKIEYVEYNPYWGIPKSILVNEMLPKLRKNASYFDNLGYEMTTVKGTPISSRNVNWYSVGADFPYNVRQPPGAKNALGELKIMFPNKHSIYMHDTPAKSLFQRKERAFSHGCVRLADPRAMAAAVLGSDVQSVVSRLSGGKNNTQVLNQKIPVYVSYYTAWPDSEGNVRFYKDIYERDAALDKALKKEAAARANARDV